LGRHADSGADRELAATELAEVNLMYRLITTVMVLFCCSTYSIGQKVPQFDQRDIKLVVRRVNDALTNKDAQLIGSLVSPKGASFVPIGTDTDLPNHQNRSEIVEIFRSALSTSQVSCLGYDPHFGTLPDKAIIYVQGLEFTSSPLPERTGLWGLQFLKDEKGLWWFTWITPVAGIYIPEPKALLACGEA
jgi:hypothetical protein